jgi:hypothetical protein
MKTGSPRTHQKLNFTAQEDALLKGIVGELGDGNWAGIAERIPGRNPRQCKDRWMNYLSPAVTTIPWSSAEDQLLLEKIKECGHRWVRIAEFFPMRRDAHIKNRYIVLQRRERKQSAVVAKHERTKLPPLSCLCRGTNGLEKPPLRQVAALQPVETAAGKAAQTAEAQSLSILEFLNP